MNDVLQKEFELIVFDLINRHNELGMKSSGRWIESLEIKTLNNNGVIYANSYTEQLVNGRANGKFPPIKSIEQWIIDKPIALENGMKVSTLAFLIARKIAKEGTRYFQQGGTDLVDSVITPERIQMIIDKVSEFQISEFVSDITNVFKKIAV